MFWMHPPSQHNQQCCCITVRLAALLGAPIRNQQTAVVEPKPRAQWHSQPHPSVSGQKSLLAHRPCSDFTDSGCEMLVSFHHSDLTAGPTRSHCSTSIRSSSRLLCFCHSDHEQECSSYQMVAKIISKWHDEARLNFGTLLEGSCTALIYSLAGPQLVKALWLVTAGLWTLRL